MTDSLEFFSLSNILLFQFYFSLWLFKQWFSPVIPEMILSPESLMTNITSVRTFISVCAFVNQQIVRLCESTLTVFADKLLLRSSWSMTYSRHFTCEEFSYGWTCGWVHVWHAWLLRMRVRVVCMGMWMQKIMDMVMSIWCYHRTLLDIQINSIIGRWFSETREVKLWLFL